MTIRFGVFGAILGFAGCAPHPAPHDNMRELANQRAAQCKQNPALQMCKQAPPDNAQGGGNDTSAAASSSAPAASTGRLVIDNQGCNSNPSYKVAYLDGNGGGATGLANGTSEVDVDHYPLTVCFTIKDPNACATNTVTVKSAAQKVVATSCSHLKVAHNE